MWVQYTEPKIAMEMANQMGDDFNDLEEIRLTIIKTLPTPNIDTDFDAGFYCQRSIAPKAKSTQTERCSNNRRVILLDFSRDAMNLRNAESSQCTYMLLGIAKYTETVSNMRI